MNQQGDGRVPGEPGDSVGGITDSCICGHGEATRAGGSGGPFEFSARGAKPEWISVCNTKGCSTEMNSFRDVPVRDI